MPARLVLLAAFVRGLGFQLLSLREADAQKVEGLEAACSGAVEEFLRPDPEEYLFRPCDAVAEHHARRAARRRSKRTPSEMKRRRKKAPRVQPGIRYNRRSYRQAVVRACEKAGVPVWSPLQLRHGRATEIRRRYGLEASQCVLGHERADVTQLYAERNEALAARIMAEVG
jgi:integrase